VLVLNSFELQGLALLMPPFMLAIAGLMVSNIQYPSFKEVDWQTSARSRTFIGLILLLGVAFVFKELFFAIAFFAYIFYGPCRHLLRLRRARRHLDRKRANEL